MPYHIPICRDLYTHSSDAYTTFDLYRVAKMHRMPYLHRSYSAEQPYGWRLFCGKRSATYGIVSLYHLMYRHTLCADAPKRCNDRHRVVKHARHLIYRHTSFTCTHQHRHTLCAHTPKRYNNTHDIVTHPRHLIHTHPSFTYTHRI